MKAHLGCGIVYLHGYINVDVAPHFLSSDLQSAKIIEENGTTFDNYYKTDFNNRPQFVVADRRELIGNLSFQNESLDEVVMIQVLEHIPNYEREKVLEEIRRVLKIGGTFIVGVPDVKGTAAMLSKAETNEEEDWCIRLLYGTQRNQFSHHFCGYTKRTLKKLLSNSGFGDFEDMPNINFYPSVHIKAFRME
jgi:SAM-dependent methyltransferase